MENLKNIAIQFFETVRRHPEKPALLSDSGRTTYVELAGMISVFAAHFEYNGVKPGSVISIKTDDPQIIIASLFASALNGCGWVYENADFERLSDVQVTHKFAMWDEDEKPRGDRWNRIDETWQRPPSGYAPDKPPRFPGFQSDEDVWVYLPSSGTTGTPKYMEFGHANMVKRIQACFDEFPTGDEKCVFLFAQHSPPTLFRALSLLISGGSLVYGLDPSVWLTLGVSHVFASPRQIQELLPEEPLPCKLRKALIGGDGMSEALAASLLQNFEVVVNTYGATETSIVLQNRKTLVDDGTVRTETLWRDSDVEIVDDAGQRVAPGAEGFVRIRNAYLAPGYLKNASAEGQAFRDGWFYPGDKGVISREGDFATIGRQSDILNLGGIKVNINLLEFTLQAVPGVNDAIVFLLEEEGKQGFLVALVQADEGAVRPDIIFEAKIMLASAFSSEVVPDRFIFTQAIPRIASGKPDRKACIEQAKAARDSQKAT
ncbi:acyl--CoA ligase [Aliiroseovarius sp. S1123]|uniref:class I adenylate-forming enzyme family protein n=1 Tax=unclassified Aliiroseovarius TaxID=2623558 RepID=UPI001FF2798C|nr:class I adenylate-forming enzyme family protein [Aliiroseovarius sp. S1123]MCK0172078.1 acyl--CoA ligase [Aliiroseovarius sp. S1123]